MAKGRKALPTGLKVIKGTFRKDRVPDGMPDADIDGMKAPAWLPPEAVEHFGVFKSRVEALGLNSKTFTEVAALAALRMSEIEKLTEIIKSDGPVYESVDDGGKLLKKSHPAVSQRSEAARHLQGLLSEFGLSPAAIQKIGGGKKEKKSAFAEFMNG